MVHLYMHVVLAWLHALMHHADMASITKRLEKRYVVEGDELARDALAAIRELRAALAAMVLDPVAALNRARQALKAHH